MAERQSVAYDPDAPIRSPCIGICELDGRFGLCRGCLRSADEIATWRDAGASVRRQILERIHRRRQSDYLAGMDRTAHITLRSTGMSKA